MKLRVFCHCYTVLCFFISFACAEDPSSTIEDQEGDSDEASSESQDVRETDSNHVTDSDDTDGKDDVSHATCTHLFGSPTVQTGLSDEMCKPFFNCEGVAFHPPTYTTEEIEWLESRILVNPPVELSENPYDQPDNYPDESDKFCGVLFEDAEKKTYRLETFETMADLENSGAQLTHSGACGHCSSLQNLAVYIKNKELTGPVKSCGAKGLFAKKEKTIQCLMDVGFDRICATVWYYNTKNTGSECILKCLDDFFKTKYHNSDGSLNDCIQCDEDKSGPVFKATSGRTRRNSGLPSALCRPCNSVTPVVHHYQ